MAIIKLTKENFDGIVTDKSKTVIVDFWAEWCGPCRMLAPVLEKLCEVHPDVTVGKVNVDEERELAMQFNIMSIPTIHVYKNGEKEISSVGYKTLEQLEEYL